MVTSGYISQKLDILMNYRDTDIMEVELDTFFDHTKKFSSKNDLNFAVAFTAYDSVTEPILDPTIGELAFKAYEWG